MGRKYGESKELRLLLALNAIWRTVETASAEILDVVARVGVSTQSASENYRFRKATEWLRA